MRKGKNRQSAGSINHVVASNLGRFGPTKTLFPVKVRKFQSGAASRKNARSVKEADCSGTRSRGLKVRVRVSRRRENE